MSMEYEDILELPHHVSTRRRHMTLEERAAQFAPFAALTGFETAISEAGRQTDLPIEMGEYLQDLLDSVQREILEADHPHPAVAITHFVPDERKDGGTYKQTVGQLKRVDPESGQILLKNGASIPIHSVIRMTALSTHSGELFGDTLWEEEYFQKQPHFFTESDDNYFPK